MKENAALSIVKSVAGANEVKMLNIRPYVAPEDYCFNVYECDLAETLRTMKEQGYLGDNYLVITSFGAFEASKRCLPGKYQYAFITDTKTDKLDHFIAHCHEASYSSGAVESEKEEGALLKQVATAKEIGDDQKYAAAQETLKNFRTKRWNYYIEEAINKDAVQTVVALGGGVSMDAGQYVATHLARELGKSLNFLCIPTVLSVNAAFCYKAAMRVPAPGQDNVPYAERKYEVKYDSDLVQPDVLLIDPSVVLSAGELNVVGAGDLLSCLTASFDWKLNSLIARNYLPKGQSVEKRFNQEICDGAMELIGLLAESIDDLNAMREYAKILKAKPGASGLTEDEANTKLHAEAGLRFICRAYHWVAEQSWLMQHTMWESASEHGMFDYMEYLCGTEFTHGQIIGLCVYFMSRLQENEHERAVSMIKRLKLDITLNNLASEDSNNSKVTPEKLYECLKGLKGYLTGESYRYTIVSAKDITEDWIEDALKAYYTDFPEDYAGRPNKGVEKYKN